MRLAPLARSLTPSSPIVWGVGWQERAAQAAALVAGHEDVGQRVAASLQQADKKKQQQQEKEGEGGVVFNSTVEFSSLLQARYEGARPLVHRTASQPAREGGR